jgi:2-amino-4-hydroxy-6-hydroxymethyldihydropteridine diphosphokinase
MATAYVALGANLGDRLGSLRRAVAGLHPDFVVQAVSPVYETEPAYVLDQPRFYNMAAQVSTELRPLEALRRLKQLEAEAGRTAGPRFGPRLIDLDLLLHGDTVMETPELILPHPRLHERAFVLRPLADIAPDAVHPALGRTIRELLMDLGDTSGAIWPAGVEL